MKIRVGFKTPDAVECALDNADLHEASEDEAKVDAFFEAKALLEKYIEYGECINLEFDTDSGTVTVLEA